MPWLAALRRYLFPPPDPTPGTLGPLAVTPALATALEGQGLRVELVPLGGRWAVRTTPTSDLSAPLVGGVPLWVSPTDNERLRGVTLDVREGRIVQSIDLRVVARETPNPNSRIYLLNRELSIGVAWFGTEAVSPPGLAQDVLAIPGVRAVLFRAGTATVERVPGAAWAAIDVAFEGVVREHFLGFGSAVVPSERVGVDATLARDVEDVITREVLPLIHRDGGHIELVDVRDGVVRVRLEGACRSCPAASATLHQGVAAALRKALGDRVRSVERWDD